MLDLEAVSFSYGGEPALREVSLAVPPGALYALLGPNGAGKSTLLNLVTTILPVQGGKVTVAGQDAARAPDEVRRRIGYAPEEPLLYSGLTAREMTVLSATLHGRDDGEARAAEVLGELGLLDRADDVLASFSKGMRRKALLAAALVHDPEVLVLDEPLDGLDVVARERLKALLRARAAAGKTVLYSTHTLEVVETLCTHVAILRKGRLAASGTLAEVRAALGIGDLTEAFAEAEIDRA